LIILGFVLIGLIGGFLANLIVGGGKRWQAYQYWAAGLIGSFVGGTLLSVLLGEGFDIRIGGILGSTVGAIIVLLVYGAWERMTGRDKPPSEADKLRADNYERHRKSK
jgi:uncharacterized membrane protein YeaQ/YmgE (transglycosylase-associated protein family)